MTRRPGARPAIQEVPAVIRMTIAFIVVFLVATFPATWLLMLFLGNIGTNLSYWGTLPLGILVSLMLAGVSAPSTLSNTTIVRG
jgi:hypothetical protein